MKHKNFLYTLLTTFLALVFGLSILPYQRVHAQVAAGLCYVREGAGGLNNGSSWTDAYTSLQSALGNASCMEIWVAAGTYKPSDTMDRTVAFVLKNHVEIYGGFAGDETDRSQRDWEQHQTILSGDLGGDDTGSVAMDEPTRQDNSYHVLFGSSLHNNWVPIDSSAVLDGFTVQGGNANGEGLGEQNGGGLFNHQQSSPTLRNLIFQANSAGRGGGVMNFAYSSPAFTNVILQNNTASISGAAMCTQAGGSPTLDDVVFRENNLPGTANTTSIMENVQGNPVLSHVDFIGNHGLAMTNSYADSILMNVTFINNDGGGSTGAMYNSMSSPILVNVLFLGNSSDRWPGGMLNLSSNPVLINVTFSQNSGAYMANAVYNFQSHPVIKNSILWGDSKGEIYNADSVSGVTISNSLVQGWTNDPANQVWGDRDPRFADAALGDLRLTPASPAIEQGDNAVLPADSLDIDGDGDTQETLPVDLEGSARTVDNDHAGEAKVDLGAYEFQGDYDAPPSVSAGGPYQMTEGDFLPITGSTFDPRGDPLSLQWKLNTGASCTISDPSALATDVGCSENGNYTLTFTASDANSVVNSTAGLVVNNAAPLVGVIDGPAETVHKEATVQFSAGFTDVGTKDTHIARWDWGDGTTSTGSVTEANGVGSVIGSHAFAASGNYNVQLTVTDDDKGAGTASLAVVVAQSSPPTVNAGGPYSGAEGTAISLSGSASDPDGDTLTYIWSVNAATPCTFTDPSDPLTTVSCTDNGSYVLTLMGDDGQGYTDQTTTSLTISNASPVVGAITAPLIPTQIGLDGKAQITASASFSDAGQGDTHTGTWDWGDGSNSPATITEAFGSGSADGTHVYTMPGVYEIILTISDDDASSGSAVFQYVVVYDPGAGFVTGGGWIDSPAGAYYADPALSGQATFGFVSKYQKGATAPTGTTQFQFSIAGLSFYSETYEWLVVNKSGTNAQFKGSGLINGTADPNGNAYKFMLWAGDGAPDTFRIRIWWEDAAGEHDVYDNGVTQAIANGSIVVHTSK